MCHCDDVNVKLCYAFICSDYYICGCRFYIRGGDGQMMTDDDRSTYVNHYYSMWYCYDFSQSDSIYDDFTSEFT